MLLTVETLDAKGKPCSSSCTIVALEDSAEFLSFLLSQQHTLLQAQVWDNGTCITLFLENYLMPPPKDE